jgi:hypothetical protein
MTSQAQDRDSQARRGLSQRFFAWVMAQGDPPEFVQAVEGYKKRLFSDLKGTLVELGPGAGANFAHYPKGIRWIGIEPNVYMHPHLENEAAKFDLPIEIRTMTAERLDVEDASADAAISTLVMCSVNDQAIDLADIETRR